MRKILLTAVTALAAGVMLTGSVALASAQAAPHRVTASSHGYVVVHGHRTTCDTLINGDVNGSRTRFHVSPITNTCNDLFRALALCIGRNGTDTREYGPWKSAYGESNTSPCPTNSEVYEGATQFPYHDRKTYCLYGCSASLLAYQVRTHIRPQLVAPGTRPQAVNCSYSGKFNTDGASFYSANLHSSTCTWETFRGAAKCYIGHSTSKARFFGPWQLVQPGATWSRANCANGDTLYKGGFQASAAGSGARTMVWRYTAPRPVRTVAVQRTDCTLNYAHHVNDQSFPVWAESRSRTSTTCQGQQRSVILVCLRGNCGGGFFHGGWIFLSNHTLNSRALSKVDRAALFRAWFEDRGGPGQDVQCQEYFPVQHTNTFDCDPADQP